MGTQTSKGPRSRHVNGSHIQIGTDTPYTCVSPSLSPLILLSLSCPHVPGQLLTSIYLKRLYNISIIGLSFLFWCCGLFFFAPKMSQNFIKLKTFRGCLLRRIKNSNRKSGIEREVKEKNVETTDHRSVYSMLPLSFWPPSPADILYAFRGINFHKPRSRAVDCSLDKVNPSILWRPETAPTDSPSQQLTQNKTNPFRLFFLFLQCSDTRGIKIIFLAIKIFT